MNTLVNQLSAHPLDIVSGPMGEYVAIPIKGTVSLCETGRKRMVSIDAASTIRAIVTFIKVRRANPKLDGSAYLRGQICSILHRDGNWTRTVAIYLGLCDESIIKTTETGVTVLMPLWTFMGRVAQEVLRNGKLKVFIGDLDPIARDQLADDYFELQKGIVSR